MRFFPSSSLTGANRPRSRSSATSSSSSSSIDADVRYGGPSSDTYSPTQPPPPTRTSTGLPTSQSSRAPLPVVSLEANKMAAPSTRLDQLFANTSAMPMDGSADPSTSCAGYLYSAFPPEICKEVEEYDRRASQAEPLHYFSDNQHAQYVCKECMVPLALQDEVVSKAFSGSLGRAYLLHSTVNTYLGKKEEKRLLTGIHTVADLHCRGCQQLGKKTTLGWMYLKAKERDQEYKEGKYILEAGRVIKENNWSLDD